MSGAPGIRGIANKIKKLKRITSSLESAKEEIKLEADKMANEFEEVKNEIEDILQTLKSGK